MIICDNELYSNWWLKNLILSSDYIIYILDCNFSSYKIIAINILSILEYQGVIKIKGPCNTNIYLYLIEYLLSTTNLHSTSSFYINYLKYKKQYYRTKLF